MTLFSASAAREAIAGIAVETPVLAMEPPDAGCAEDVWLKLENLQVTGSFKVRGAANKLLALTPGERARGVITCSSGNHGRAVAFVAELLEAPATVCVPDWVDATKLAAMKRHGAEVVLEGKTYDEAEARSMELAPRRGLAYVHPFDDPHVIAGQGTVGLELLEQLPGLAGVVVPLSGGGLVAGVARVVKSYDPAIRVVAVSATNARVMFESQRAGRPIAFPEEQTVASALSGGIGQDNRYTFRMIRELVDEHVLVSEEEIRGAMAVAGLEYHVMVEGGGAVGLAAVLAGVTASLDGKTAVVVSGGNVGVETLAGMMTERSESETEGH